MRTPCMIAGLVSLFACGHLSTERASGDSGGERARPGQEGTGSVGVVDGDDLHAIPNRRPELLMSGRIAGVQVVSLPGGGIAVRIRGQGPLYGDSEPLYVIDGMPVRTEPGKGLSWLNSGDIKRIEVLKDAIATSSYGMRGANGVVLITTRRGTDER